MYTITWTRINPKRNSYLRREFTDLDAAVEFFDLMDADPFVYDIDINEVLQ